jgi:hypothetical protein
MLIAVPVQCKGRTYFLQQIEIVVSNPTQSMDVYVNIYFVFVLSCIGGSLGMGRPPGPPILFSYPCNRP